MMKIILFIAFACLVTGGIIAVVITLINREYGYIENIQEENMFKGMVYFTNTIKNQQETKLVLKIIFYVNSI